MSARVHALHREMAGDMRTTHALRLGFRKIKGLSEQDGKLIVAGRNSSYGSVRELWLRTGLSPRVIARLADADAFGSLGLTRRQALWAAKALGRVGGKDDDLPLFRTDSSSAAHSVGSPPHATRARPGCVGREQTEFAARAVSAGNGDATADHPREPEVRLPLMPPGEEVVNDYRFLELSLRAHPVSFLRADLARRGTIRNEELRAAPSSTRVTVSGLVTIRQRPGSANGVIFMTIEDETAVANIIVWPKTFARFRHVILGARYVAVSGEVQQESGVIHVVARKLDDLTSLLARLTADAPPIEALARADEPGSGECPARALIEGPRWPLASLASAARADALKRPHDENIDSRARGRRNPPRIAAPAQLPDLLASDLDVPARGSAHAPSRLGGSKITRR
jgi:error-prone DNA polymerase